MIFLNVSPCRQSWIFMLSKSCKYFCKQVSVTKQSTMNIDYPIWNKSSRYQLSICIAYPTSTLFFDLCTCLSVFEHPILWIRYLLLTLHSICLPNVIKCCHSRESTINQQLHPCLCCKSVLNSLIVQIVEGWITQWRWKVYNLKQFRQPRAITPAPASLSRLT